MLPDQGSIYAQIQTSCRSVVGQGLFSLARPVEYRTVTTNRAVEPREYTDWMEGQGLTTGLRHQEVMDERTGGIRRITTCFLRVADDAMDLQETDEVRFWADGSESPDGSRRLLRLSVVGISTSGPGSRQYVLSNQKLLKATPDRAGGS